MPATSTNLAIRTASRKTLQNPTIPRVHRRKRRQRNEREVERVRARHPRPG